MSFIQYAMVAGLLAMGVSTASAQVTEVRIGIGEFSEGFINPGSETEDGIEQSWALQGEVIFDEPEFLKWALTPQPYINGTLNLEGNTNHAGAGLLWRQSFGEKIYSDFAFGASIHDGTIDHDIRDYIVNNMIDFEGYGEALNTQREFGSRVLFREQLTLGYRITPEWSAEVFFEHLSNGFVLGRRPDPNNRFDRRDNDAVDTLGFRVAKRFN